MTLCLADCIAEGFSEGRLSDNFLEWYEKSEYTTGGYLFDIGNATADSLSNIRQGVPCLEAGGAGEWSNGNGSLMRIAPLVLYTKDMPVKERFNLCKNVSSITHRHSISISACFIYLEFLRSLILRFDFLDENLKLRKRNEIKSSGFVIDTLTAGLWCVLTTDSYKTAVLKAVNLGEDTDTTGAVTGVIAGLLYGYSNIPKEWITVLKNKELIDLICKKFENTVK